MGIESAVAAADAHARAGRWREALDLYANLLARRLERDDAVSGCLQLDATDAALIERTADAAIVAGKSRAAAKLLQVLIGALRRSGNRYMTDLTAAKLLRLAATVGDRAQIASALDELAPTIGAFDSIPFDAAGLADFEQRCRWLDVKPHERATFFVAFYRAAGRLFAWLGQYNDAVAALRRGLEHAPALAGVTSGHETAMRLDLASAVLGCGDIAGCRRTIAEAQGGPDPVDQARQHELLGHCSLLAGEFANAERGFRQALEYCDRHGLINAGIVTRLNLCYVLVTLNRTVDAQDILVAAAQVVRALGDPQLAARIVQMQALVAARRASSSRSFSFAPANIEQWEGTGAPVHDESAGAQRQSLSVDAGATLLERLGEYTLVIYQLFERRQFAQAVEWLATMQQIFSASDSPLIGLRLRLLAMMATYYRGDYHSAASQLDPLRVELRQRQLRHDLWLACCFGTWCARRIGQHGKQQGELIEELRSLTETMSQGLPPEQRVVFELNKWNQDEVDLAARLEKIAQAADRNRRRPWLFRVLSQIPARARLDRLVTRIDARRLALLNAGPAPGKRRPWWLRMALAPRQRMTLSFLLLPDRLVVVREGFFLFDVSQFAATRLLLRELVRQWHESLKLNSDSGDLRQLAEQICDQLHLREMLETRRDIRELRIVPDDVLCGFPFAAMRWRDQYLVQHSALTIDTCHVPARPKSRQRQPVTATVVAMGLGAPGVPELPGVYIEAGRAATRLRESGIDVSELRDAAATPESVLRCLANADVLHVACHGAFAPDDMRNTGLMLFGAGSAGLLSMMDITAVRGARTQLVTLSSCWSADNYILPGRNIVSLPQVFRAAGVHSVVSCLWEVDDATAVAFFDRFYQLSASLSAFQALRQVQLEFMKPGAGGANTTNEFFWAGFVLNCGP